MELTTISLRCAFFILATIYSTDADGHWGYDEHDGPHHWRDLFPKACSGKYQSPINIHRETSIYNSELREFAIWYDPPRPGSNLRVINNGHTVQVNTNGDFFVTNGGLKSVYKTVQFHFHWGSHNKHGSEHFLDGEAGPLELHIVNYNYDKYDDIAEAVTEPEGLAVLGVMFEIVEEDNPVFKTIIEALEKIKNPDVNVEVELPPMSMRDLLPTDITRYYRYNGSLTTPGCFESVIWTVFDERQTISQLQIAKFREVMRKKKHHQNKKSKRSTRKDRREQQHGAKAVIDELGIEGDIYEEEKLKEELMEMKKPKAVSSEKNDEDTVENNDKITHSIHANEKDSRQDLKTEKNNSRVVTLGNHEKEGTSYVIGVTGNEENVEDEESEEVIEIEIIHEKLVDNFRPIQPLNDRVVFRSFKLLYRPRPRVYGVSQEDNINNTGSINFVTLFILILSAVVVVFFKQ